MQACFGTSTAGQPTAFASLDRIIDVSCGVCKIELPRAGTATGFLSTFQYGDWNFFGLFTNNHVVKRLPRDPVVCLFRSRRRKLRCKDYFFTDPDLDATFIELDPTEFGGLKFLDVDRDVYVDDSVIILQHPAGAPLTSKEGVVVDVSVDDLWHKVPTLRGSSGSPVLNLDFKVVGIHKGEDERKGANVAVRMRAVLEAIHVDLGRRQKPTEVVERGRAARDDKMPSETKSLPLPDLPSKPDVLPLSLIRYRLPLPSLPAPTPTLESTSTPIPEVVPTPSSEVALVPAPEPEPKAAPLPKSEQMQVQTLAVTEQCSSTVIRTDSGKDRLNTGHGCLDSEDSDDPHQKLASNSSAPTQNPVQSRKKQKQMLMLIGGKRNKKTSSSVSRLDFHPSASASASASLFDVSPMKSPRHAAAAAATADGLVIVAGGVDHTGDTTRSVEQYDPATNSWKRLSDMHYARANHALITVGNSVFAIGGYGEKKNGYLSAVEQYNTESRRWRMADSLIYERKGFAVCALHDKILVAGGEGCVNFRIEFFSTCELYDVADPNGSKMIAPLNKGRMNAAAAAHNNRVFVFGGVTAVSGNSKSASRIPKFYLNDVEQYDPTADKWTLVEARLSYARCDARATSIGGCIYVVGGKDKKSASNSIDQFDPISQKFVATVQLPYTISGSSLAVTNVD